MKEVLCYTVPEAASLLKLSKSTLYTLLKSGQIKSVKINSTYRITAEEIERVLTDGVSGE